MRQLVVATREHAPIIRGIAEEVWPVAYKDIITQAQMHYMLQNMYSDAALAHQMEHEGCIFFLIQENDVFTGFAGTSMVESHTAKLHKLYVLSTGQRGGRGSFLLNAVEEWSRSQGATALELQVNKHNSAQHFYTKHGFENVRSAVFDIGHGYVMDDYIFRKSL